MCEECGYTLIHRMGCTQRTSTGDRQCRICDGSVEHEDTYVAVKEGRHTAFICCSCLEEMDLYEIKELFGFTETLELVARLADCDSRISVSRSDF